MLTVAGDGIPEPIQLSLDDLKSKFHPVDITATIMCGGNRRNELNSVAEIPGLKWGSNAISTALWRGVRLRDVLLHAGFNFKDLHARHVQFEGLDRGVDGAYGASIPLDSAASGDVVLAYEMNGQPLPVDHGFPLRAVVPGVVGARNVKWLHKITTSCDESSSPWQQSDYKLYPQTVRSLSAAKGSMSLPIQSTPV
jgi:sulfite oxidase